MTYLNILMTIFVIMVMLILWASVPSKKELKAMREKQDDHIAYQKRINLQMMHVHNEILTELKIMNINTREDFLEGFEIDLTDTAKEALGGNPVVEQYEEESDGKDNL